MKTKLSCLVWVLSFIAASGAHAELVRLFIPSDEGGNGEARYSSKEIVLEEGEKAEVLFMQRPQHSQSTSPSKTIALAVEMEGEEILMSSETIKSVGSSVSLGTTKFPIVAGPAKIRLRSIRVEATFATVNVTRGGVPSGTIVVPEDDLDAVYDVFLEASTDLRDWVRVIPGDYAASGAARFFRVRLVKK